MDNLYIMTANTENKTKTIHYIIIIVIYNWDLFHKGENINQSVQIVHLCP